MKTKQDLQEFILNDYPSDGRLKFLLDTFTAGEILSTIQELLHPSDNTRHWRATAFLRDIFIGSDLTKKQYRWFLTELRRSKTLEYLGSFLYAPHWNVRHATIFALGKLTQRRYRPLLEDAFQNCYLYQDPLSASQAIFEIQWLSGKIADDQLEQLLDQELVVFGLLAARYFEHRPERFLQWMFERRENLPAGFSELAQDHRNGRSLEAVFQNIADRVESVDIHLRNLLTTLDIALPSAAEVNALACLLAHREPEIRNTLSRLGGSLEWRAQYYSSLWEEVHHTLGGETP